MINILLQYRQKNINDMNFEKRMKANLFFAAFEIIMLSIIYSTLDKNEVVTYILLLALISFPAYVIMMSHFKPKKRRLKLIS